MPKTKARKKGTAGHARTVDSARNRTNTVNQGVGTSPARNEGGTKPGGTPVRARQSARGYQGLVLPAMVALGCWGLAISFMFFTPDPNHLIYGGIAVLMALMWTASCWLRLRRLRSERAR